MEMKKVVWEESTDVSKTAEKLERLASRYGHKIEIMAYRVVNHQYPSRFTLPTKTSYSGHTYYSRPKANEIADNIAFFNKRLSGVHSIRYAIRRR